MSLSVGGTGWDQELGQLRPHSPLGHSPRLLHTSLAAEATAWDFSFSFWGPVSPAPRPKSSFHRPACLHVSIPAYDLLIPGFSCFPMGALEGGAGLEGRGSSPGGPPFTCWEKHKQDVWWGGLAVGEGGPSMAKSGV